MLDISFSEIAVIGAVALVVLGPERLPKVARTAGHLFGRLQRYVNGVKADIAREMENSELAKIKQEVQDAARSFEKAVHEHASDVKTTVETEAKSIQQITEQATADTASTSLTPALPDMGSSASFSPPNPSNLSPPPPAPGSGAFSHVEGALFNGATFGQGLFDFGIEPSRLRTLTAPNAMLTPFVKPPPATQSSDQR